MTDKLYLYPRGILAKYHDIVDDETGSVVMSNIIYVSGSSAVNDIYNRFNNNSKESEGPLLAASIAAVWLRVVGDDFRGWLKLQEKNMFLKPRMANFLVDTVKLINGVKERDMPAYNWGNMIEDIDTKVSSVNNYDLLVNTLPENSMQIMSDWLCRTNGMTDMMFSLQILFGKEKPVYNPSSILQHLPRTMPYVQP